MDIYQEFCDGVVQTFEAELANLKKDHQTELDHLSNIYNQMNASSNQTIQREVALHSALNKHRESVVNLSDTCILDALQGSCDIENNALIWPIRMLCRQMLANQLRNLPELLPSDIGLNAMDDFLADDRTVVQFPDDEVVFLISQINPNQQIENDSDNGPTDESD